MTQKEREQEKKRMITLLRKEYGDDVWLCSTKCGVCNAYTQYTDIETVVDYLLSNGVIVPPCKVGDGIYLITKNSSVPAMTRIDNVLFDGDEFQYNMDDDMFFDFSEDDIGKTAFATYKAAEQALKEFE